MTKTARFFKISELARELGVSTQTIRVWERGGRIPASRRSAGGQRLYSEDAMREAALEIARGKRTAGAETAVQSRPAGAVELASTGARIKRARMTAGLSQVETASRLGISRTFLSTVERGQSGVSVQTLARMADLFGIQMGDFALLDKRRGRVVRVKDRPKTVLGGGVTWHELASPGHALEPAILMVPPGADNGGVVVRTGEIFVLVLTGEITFNLQNPPEALSLKAGDSIILDAGLAHAWRNPGRKPATCVWVEQISARSKSCG